MRMKNGFTLMETLVVISVFSLMMGVVFYSIVSFYKMNSYTIEQAVAINSARSGIETMVREIREATYSDMGAYPVVSAEEQSLLIYSDIDKDNNVEKNRYFLDGADFKKGEIESTGNPPVYSDTNEVIIILSDSVRNGADTIFTYYDSSGNEISGADSIADISLVKVNLIINVDESRKPGDFVLRSNAQMRNLKTNL